MAMTWKELLALFLVLTLVGVALYGTYRASSECEALGGVAVKGTFGGIVCVDSRYVIKR